MSNLKIHSVEIAPDISRLNIVSSKVQPIITEWEEINELQQKLIDSLKIANSSMDFQNIGNIARTIMQKISNKLYIHEKHKPTDPKKLVTPDKYKNRLDCYLDYTLKGKNERLRAFSITTISLVADACDLMNATTHKLDADKDIAEITVVATISAISIINIVRKEDRNNTSQH